ncbi:MAG: flagellar hook-basal body complex protein FliE [Candidatus Sericytochromatia bacterium]|nr:flagellar hook-basal body complex protein FliE [Candidatus Tanganyikabacteria bacterium]
MDRLAPPQGFVGREFPDIQKPARTLGEPPPAATIRVGPQAVGPVTDLGRLFKPLEDFIGEVNSTALYASDMQQAFASGENVDLHDVMIAAEKSSVATQLTSQVRTKLLEAYQEIWRMQV